MPLLLLFALVAGAGTAITPCVLPVLPALLSAGAAGGRRRPLGIVVGLAATFTIAIVALAQLVKGVGLASGAARTAAIVLLIACGLIMLLPELGARVQAPLSRLARFGPKTRGEGFATGLAVGGALGFVCAPCAGPILAAVTSVSASAGASVRVVAVAIAYAIGLSAVLLLYALGGRAVIARIRRSARGPLVERTLGVVLVATGVVMAANLDVRFEEALAKNRSLPAFLVDPTRALENSGAVQKRLASLRPASRFATRQQQRSHDALPDLGTAPEFVDTQRWFNSRPLTLRQLQGHVVLVDFWTYTCINCIRTLPFLKGLYATYHPAGLQIVGVETPEFTFEHDAGNVAQAIRDDGLRYPIVQDNNFGTWNAYQNQAWPAEYLIDANGQVRHVQVGEGDYDKTEAAVRTLLLESGHRNLPFPTSARALTPSRNLQTPETYLDPHRAQGFAQPPQLGVHTYAGVSHPQVDEFALKGSWRVTSEYATPAASGTSIQAGFQAAKVYLVLTSSANRPRAVAVFLDGRRYRTVTVRGQTLYTLVSLRSAEQHELAVSVPPGVRAYDFTFG